MLELMVIALIMFIATQVSVKNYRVDGSSMSATLEDGQRILVNKLVYLRFDWSPLENFFPSLANEARAVIYPFESPRRGDVVVFRAPMGHDVDFVKRIIALPGETIAIRGSRVYIEGEILAEPYLNASFMQNMDSYVVPLNGYFVMGDNRYHSNDSRHWDAVPSENIIGKAWLSYWPRYRAGFLNIGEWSLMSH
jgi:signal peptidase I